MSVSSAAVSVLLNLKLLTLNVNIDNLIKTQKSHTNVSNYQNGILPLLIRMYRVPVLKFHPFINSPLILRALKSVEVKILFF